MNPHFFTAPSFLSFMTGSFHPITGFFRAVLLDEGTPYALEILGTEAQIHFPHSQSYHFHTDLSLPFYWMLGLFSFVASLYDGIATKKNK